MRNYTFIILYFLLSSIKFKNIEGTSEYHKFLRQYHMCGTEYYVKEKGEIYNLFLSSRQKFIIKGKGIDTKFYFYPSYFHYTREYYKRKNGEKIFEKSQNVKDLLYLGYAGIEFENLKGIKGLSLDLGIVVIQDYFLNEKVTFPFIGGGLYIGKNYIIYPSLHYLDSPVSGILILEGIGINLNLKRTKLSLYFDFQKHCNSLCSALSIKLNIFKNVYFLTNVSGSIKLHPKNKYTGNFGIGINF